MIDHFELNRLHTVYKYVCTFRQAKLLYELGIRKESMFYYFLTDCKAFRLRELRHRMFRIEASDGHYERIGKTVNAQDSRFHPGAITEIYSAFTSQELGELIGKELIDELSYEMVISTSNSMYNFIMKTKSMTYDCSMQYKSEAQARAEFLIYLLENKKINKDDKFEWFDEELKDFMNNIDTFDVNKMSEEQRKFFETRMKQHDDDLKAMIDIHESGMWRGVFPIQD